MKRYIKLLLILNAFTASAQYTGINTTTPKATLDIQPKHTDGSTAEGLLIPRLSGDQLQSMTAILSQEQNGMMVFVTTGVTAVNVETQNVILPGMYRLQVQGDGSTMVKNWIRLEPSGLEKIRNAAGDTGWRYIGEDRSFLGSFQGKHSTDLSYTTTGSAFGSDDEAIPILSGFTITNLYSGGQELITRYSEGFLPSYYVTGGVGMNRPDIFGASGDYSFATGYRTIAAGALSHASGMDVIAAGRNSFIHGSMGYASGDFAIGMGYSPIADGDGTLAIHGQATAPGAIAIQGFASADQSVAIGNGSKAESRGTIALGYTTSENNPQKTAESDQKRRLFIIGNTLNVSSGNTPRSDAFTILRNAKTGIDIDNFENTASDAKLQVNGAIKISNNGTTDANGLYQTGTVMPCNPNNEGSLRYQKTSSVGIFQGCRENNGTYEWVNLNL